MDNFSKRNGIKVEVIGLQDIPKTFRNRLWNVLETGIENISIGRNQIIEKLWCHFLKKPKSHLKMHGFSSLRQIESEFGLLEWNKVYDFIEFIFEEVRDTNKKQKIAKEINDVFFDEAAQYQIKNYQVIQLMQKSEIEEIEFALTTNSSSVKHIQKALSRFNSRPLPDYAGVITESINAVESKMRDITGNQKGVLSDLLKKVELHESLKQGLQKIYAWTSDDSGLRHSIKDGQSAKDYESEARFMLVFCSALVNYLDKKIK